MYQALLINFGFERT